MPTVLPLPSSRLHATFDPARIPWNDSRNIPLPRAGRPNPFQPRAMQALDLALNISAQGYNIYLSGEADLGRSHMLLTYLRPQARKYPTPGDIIYVYNFTDPDRPRLFSLPAGMGKRFKQLLHDVVEHVRRELPLRFEADSYMKRHAKLVDKFQSVRLGLLRQMNSVAVDKGFNLDMDENGGLTLYPLMNGKRLSEEEFDRLDSGRRLNLKRQSDTLVQAMSGFMHQLSKAEEIFQNDQRRLEREAMERVLDVALTPLEHKMLKACPEALGLEAYFQELRNDILKNTDVFTLKDSNPQGTLGEARTTSLEAILNRYEVNLFVDNSELDGAPIIVEDNPTAVNLLGCVERESEMGALVTDFTLIRAGSIHKAHGGFLVLHMNDLLQHPNAWEGLLRALRSNQARIEDADDAPEATMRTKGIVPAPLSLHIKVVLIGDELLYETLLATDDRFPKLFRIKAHMADSTARDASNVRAYLGHIAVIIKETELPPFDRTALAWLIDLGSHLCEDQRRLSLCFPLLREFMIEASALARMHGQEIVDASLLEQAYADRTYRVNLVEELYMDDYDRETIKVQTSGQAVGQVNGLSVTYHGNFEFGLPHRISCTVGVGQEGIIDLEREAELGGPIHTKAMMILKSYLTDLFARKKPLVLSGALYFEQSYVGIEGDSASGAELVALLSALADVPVRLDLAFTGAVSQTGQIMAVGGVTRKIEGFYKVCARQGLTGTQGVIIPYDNVDHLMLAPNVLSAVDAQRFFVYPVRRIEEALTLLTGYASGRRRKNGGFTKNSLYDRVDRRLELLGSYAQNAFRRTRKE